MKQNLLERFKFWLCDTLGHLRLSDKPWAFNGMKHDTCKFCGRIHSVNEASD